VNGEEREIPEGALQALVDRRLGRKPNKDAGRRLNHWLQEAGLPRDVDFVDVTGIDLM